MNKINKRIEIVSSTAPGLSSMGQESREAILGVLNMHYSHARITLVNNLSDLEALVARKPDLVFLGMKYIPLHPELGIHDPNKIWLGKYLAEHNVLFTGSGHKAHELELDKPSAKQQVLDAGLKTSLFNIVAENQVQSTENFTLSFPVFIKPTNRGGGAGVDGFSVAHNFDQLHSKVQSISIDLKSDSLIENYLTGREFSVAILRDEHTSEFSVMPIELVAQADTEGVRILSREVKSSNTEAVSKVTDLRIRSEICNLALNVFNALGARDYGRIDIRLDGNGVAHFLEANLIPSLISGYGSFPKACSLNIDMDYETMILRIVTLALARDSETYDELTEARIPSISALLPLTALHKT